MKQVFTMSHREVYELFRSWGWEDGRKSNDGHKRMNYVNRDITSLAHGTVYTVSIMEPYRGGTGERGNEQAMRKAAKIMGMGLKEFVLGPPPKPKTPPPLPDLAAAKRMQQGMDQLAMDRLLIDELRIDNKKKEEVMSNPKPTQPIHDKGISKAVQGYLAAHKGKEVMCDEVAEHIKAVGIETTRASVQATLNHLSHGPKSPDIIKVKRGVYMHTAQPVVKYATPPDPTQEQLDEVFGTPVLKEDPREPIAMTESSAKPDNNHTYPTENSWQDHISMNGNAPSLLSKVASLDGGKLLYQGDNQELYLVTVRHLQVD